MACDLINNAPPRAHALYGVPRSGGVNCCIHTSYNLISNKWRKNLDTE